MKKGLKIALITIGVILILLVALVAIFLVKDFKVEGKINREVEEIQNIMEATDFDEEAFKKKLNSTVSTGDYYKVERAYKNYLRDYLKSINEINEFYDSLKIDDLLSADNIKNDGKDFISTKLQLNSTKKKLDGLANNFNSMKDEEKVLSYLDKNLDDYYKDYYRRIVGDIEQTATEKELSKELYDSGKIIDNIYNVFEFLSTNKNHWVFENDMIYFDTDELVNKYKSLLENITNIDETATKDVNAGGI